MQISKLDILMAVALGGVFASGPASSGLVPFQTFTGPVGYSADGWGSVSQSGTVSAYVPAGSSVLAAYLYTSTYFGFAGAGGTFGGSAVNYTSLGAPNGFLEAGRADVTSVVKPIVDKGPGGVYNFGITETSGNQDGEGLVVIYQNTGLPTATFAILDGFSLTAGDQTSVNFAAPLDPSSASFFAEMALGIGFSCCNQRSTVTVNGTTLTQNAGNNDDSADASLSNGNLITVGGWNDAFSVAMPSYENDTERYNLVSYVLTGDTSIKITTQNPSGDDNIFLAMFHVAGIAAINRDVDPIPAPGALALFGLGLAGLRTVRRRAF